MSAPGPDDYWTSPSTESKEARPQGTTNDVLRGNHATNDESVMHTNALYREKEGMATQPHQTEQPKESLETPASNSDVRKTPMSIPKGKQTRFSGVDEGERHVTPEIPKPKIQQASQSPRIPPPQALKGIPKAGKDTSAEKGCDDIKQAIKVAFKEPMKGAHDIEEGKEAPKRLKSILKNRDPYSTELLRTHSGNRVGFKRQLEFYSENDIALGSLIQFVAHTAYENCPLWHNGWFETSWNTQPVLQLTIPPFSCKEILFFFAMFVFTALIPLLTILIPITAASSGSVIDHAGFSLGMMTLLGWSMGMYSLFYFEQFFGSLLPFRCLAMIVIGPLAAGFHILVSVSLGMLLPYGPDMVILFVVFTMAIMFGVCLPKDVRKKAGFYVRLIIGASVLGVSITCIRLLTLMEAAKTRGAQVAYALVLILPVIFTRLTTDVQEALPYASSAFSIIAQGLLTWIFAATTHYLILHLAADVAYYKLFLTYYIVDMICLCGVGPIWSLWSGAAILKTSKFAQTIFGWAQNPIKPKPVIMKSLTRMLAAIVMPILLTLLNKSHNQDAFKTVSEAVFANGHLSQMWVCMLSEVATSIFFIVLIYRLMKVRCAKDAFHDVLIQFSKYTSYVLLGGMVISMHSVLLSALPANGGFLD